MKRCVQCNSLMPEDAGKCIRCGHEPGKAAAPAAARKSPPPVIEPVRWTTATGEKPGKVRGAWLLARQSWRVLMLDKELVVFPLMSAIASFLVLASFIGGAFATGVLGDGGQPSEAAAWAGLFAYYFISYFVIVYFNSALVACAMIRFRGGDPTVRDGIAAANARLPQILAWALLAASVGVLLRMLQERVQFLGRIVIAMLGAAWTIATYFIAPVLVVEKLGPFDAVKRSAGLMKETWGESLVTYVGIGLAVMLVTVAFLVLAGSATLVLFALTGSTALLVVCGILIVAFLVLAALVNGALNAIVVSALYLYAAERKMPRAFDGLAPLAFAPR